MTLKVLIVDDEAIARTRMQRLLSEMSEVQIVGQAANAAEARTLLDAHDVDLMFLDIAMPGTNGMAFVESLSDSAPMVILCTAHREHAVDAFALGAVDYVVKPVDAARLTLAVDRARMRALPRAVAAQAVPSAPAVERLPIRTRQGVWLVDPREITHVAMEGELVKVGTLTGSHLTDLRLVEIEERFNSPTFVRVHRRALVNMEHVMRLAPIETGGYVAHLRSGEEVEVSRQAARELRRALGL